MPETQTNYCDTFECEWEEEYYGWRCKKCGKFYAFGQAPWEEEDEDYEDDFGDEEYGWCGDFDDDEEVQEYQRRCEDCWRVEEFCECGELPPEAFMEIVNE